MKKWKIMLPAVVAAGSLVSWPAYAHGFGERTELPVPLGYFLIGAGLAVALSFIFISVLVKIRADASYWRLNLIGPYWIKKTLTSPITFFASETVISTAAWIGYSYRFRRGIEPITKLQPYFYMDNLVGWDGNRSGSYW
ncbi:MAG: hypothetical protein CM1200mP22_32470 [Dehalococcoidia bacterium]|nr:MAG: hypothetical protein CM1200mP22_32470 [Dehalococcoidia bacterium]